MRNILFLLVALFGVIPLVFAQAPQGLNYQAVAYDGAGVPVLNQSISVRLSILDGSATGTLAYQETQNPTTDNTGLFSIVIGNGTVVSGAFNTINWGNGTKWLKTEIDITGGTSYLVMGTSQFMSVPYALYANKAASSATFELPDGFSNVTPILLDDTIPFTVPPGKNLYVNYDYVIVDTLSFVNSIQSGGMSARPFIGISSGSQVKSDATGFLVDSTVEWKTININCTPFTVPPGKIFVIVTQYANGYSSAVINGQILNDNISSQVLKAGDFLSTDLPCSSVPNNRYFINGYLKSN